MSNFFIEYMACMALGWLARLKMLAGTICQQRPNSSLSQSHWIALGSPERRL
jgi:hypothetical protein